VTIDQTIPSGANHERNLRAAERSCDVGAGDRQLALARLHRMKPLSPRPSIAACAALAFTTVGCSQFLSDWSIGSDAQAPYDGNTSGASAGSPDGSGSGTGSGATSSEGSGVSGTSGGSGTSSGAGPSGSQTSGASGSSATGSGSSATGWSEDAGDPQGTACMHTPNCGPGFECVMQAGFSQCEQLCRSTQAECPTLFWCQTVDDGGACTQECNPLQPSASDSLHQGCVIGQRCDPSPSSNNTVCDGEAGAGQQGAFCVTSSDCAAGFFCDSKVSDACKGYCVYADGGASACPPPTTCSAFSTPVFDGTQEIGACQ
jgi:hypothetical protein